MAYIYLKTRKVNMSLWVEIVNPPVNFSTTQLEEELFSLVRKIKKDKSIRVLILTGGIEDTYIRHFSIPELEKLTPDIRRILFDKIVSSKILGRLMAWQTTFLNWLMDWVPGFERMLLGIFKKISRYSSALYLCFLMHRLYLAIERMNKITIAAINGTVNGGGGEMAACFDFRFMINDQGFTIGQLESLLGILPGGGGTQRWPRLIGKAKALEFMLRGSLIIPEDAEKAGMITGSFKKSEFYGKVQAFADEMSKRPPVAVNGIKKAVHQGCDTSLLHGLSLELEESTRCFASPATHNIMKGYNQYIKEKVEAPGIKPETINDAVAFLESDAFLESVGFKWGHAD